MLVWRYWALERGEPDTEAGCPLCHLTDRPAMLPGSPLLPLRPNQQHLPSGTSIHIHSLLLPVILSSLAAQLYCHSAGDVWPGKLHLLPGETSSPFRGNLTVPCIQTPETNTIQVWKQQWGNKPKMVKEKKGPEESWQSKQRQICFSSNILHSCYYLWLHAITTLFWKMKNITAQYTATS